MCIAVFMWQSHPLYPFILLFNRDEYYSRPTKAAGWWEGGEILGGRDEVGGGTWLACSKRGRLAFLTNFSERHSFHHAKTRGDLPLRFLKSQKNPTEFADEVIEEADQYNGFNLTLVDFHSKAMVYVTNRPKEIKPTAVQVSPGIHVLTNASLDSPWPKCIYDLMLALVSRWNEEKAQRLLHNFKETIDTYGEGEVRANEIEKLMQDRVKTDRCSLPGICAPDFEYDSSSIYIDAVSPQGRYGTRSISAVLVKANGEVYFHEQYLEDDLWKEKTITYQVE